MNASVCAGYRGLDWLVRTCAPAWLDLAGQPDEACALRELLRIVDPNTAWQATPAIQAAHKKASRAWSTQSADSTREYRRAAWIYAWNAIRDVDTWTATDNAQRSIKDADVVRIIVECCGFCACLITLRAVGRPEVLEKVEELIVRLQQSAGNSLQEVPS